MPISHLPEKPVTFQGAMVDQEAFLLPYFFLSGFDAKIASSCLYCTPSRSTFTISR